MEARTDGVLELGQGFEWRRDGLLTMMWDVSFASFFVSWECQSACPLSVRLRLAPAFHVLRHSTPCIRRGRHDDDSSGGSWLCFAPFHPRASKGKVYYVTFSRKVGQNLDPKVPDALHSVALMIAL